MDINAIAGELRSSGFCAVEQFISPALRAHLDGVCDDVCDDGATSRFAPAAVGRGEQRAHNAGFRGDVTSWLDDTQDADQDYLAVMEDLRAGLNEQLYLGLLDYEGHYAIYGTGAHYDRHMDTLAGSKNRLLSTVVYLHEEWATANGGELLLYRTDSPSPFTRILPKPGLMVLFLSEEFPHEVLAATKPRHSIAGWFRGRAPSQTETRPALPR